MIEAYSRDLIWLMVVGFIIAFILAFGIGANDVANSFGTSVGSKVLTIHQACFLATVFEIAGAILIGYKVSDTMRKGILDVSLYENDEVELMIGCLSALTASAIWLLIATFLKLPISGTHSIVGATIGFSLVARGTKGLNWITLLTIVASWFISPALSGLISVLIYLAIKHLILIKPEPIEPGLRSLPYFYGFTILINTFSIIHDGPKLFYMDKIPSWLAAVISFSTGIIIMIIVQIFIVPWQRKVLANLSEKERKPVSFTFGESTDPSPENSPKKSNRFSEISDRTLAAISETTEMLPLTIDNKKGTSAKYSFPNSDTEEKSEYMSTADPDPTSSLSTHHLNSADSAATMSVADLNLALSPNSSSMLLVKSKSLIAKPSKQTLCDVEMQGNLTYEENAHISKLFSFLQILTATFGSFAHGGNDVSNAIGPLIALWLIYTEGSVQQKSETPLYILLYGGVGISIGLWLWGRRVIQTIGEDLTAITPSTGFTIEIGAACTVLLASKIGLPISTTHCKVGSVVFVGYANASRSGVDWKLFRNIIYAWIVTVPIAVLISALCMYCLQYAVM